MPLGAFKAALMGTAGVSTGDVVLISSQTASAASAIEFKSGIGSTYGEYIFKFYNIQPGASGTTIQFDTSTDGGDNYGIAKLSTSFTSYHNEADNSAVLEYHAAGDLTLGTGAQLLTWGMGNESDIGSAGELHLFNPASTTYKKHFYARYQGIYSSIFQQDNHIAGYINTTSAINAVRIASSSGSVTGTVKLWGVK